VAIVLGHERIRDFPHSIDRLRRLGQDDRGNPGSKPLDLLSDERHVFVIAVKIEHYRMHPPGSGQSDCFKSVAGTQHPISHVI